MVHQIYFQENSMTVGFNSSGINFNFNLFNRVKVDVPGGGIIDPKTVNKHNLCYQCSVCVTYLPFGNLIIRDKIYEPYFSMKKYSSKNMFLKNY